MLVVLATKYFKYSSQGHSEQVLISSGIRNILLASLDDILSSEMKSLFMKSWILAILPMLTSQSRLPITKFSIFKGTQPSVI